MKRLIWTVWITTIILIAAAVIIAAITTFATVQPDQPEDTAETAQYEEGTEVIDRRYTPPDTYELCYHITYANGLSVDHWATVSKEEYEKSPY